MKLERVLLDISEIKLESDTDSIGHKYICE
jgi:hypothetical protein